MSFAGSIAGMGLDILELPLVGGHPAVDLVNTLARGPVEPGAGPPDRHDYLVDPAALLRWSVRAGLVDGAETDPVAEAWAGEPGSGEAALAAVRDIREALHDTLLAAMGAASWDATASGAPARLHRHWAAAAGRAALVLDRAALVLDRAGTPPVRLAVGLEPARLLPDRAAEAALDLLRSADFARLRRCPPDGGGCGWLFLDRSRNGSRRWCRMADCGTDVKARRLTERRRAARTAARAAGPR
jgi:predicted RNA-binding Zn ribbon-like protein